MAKLTQEVCLAFESESEIDTLRTQDLPYLTAVIDEAISIYLPGGSGMPRAVPEEGETLFGE